MAAVTAAIMGAAALAKAYSDRKAQKKQNQYLSQAAGQMSPNSLKERLRIMNPQLYNAVYGNKSLFENMPQNMSNSQWLDWQANQSGRVQQNPLAALYQMPGYIDPRMMNLDFNQSALNSQSSMNQFQGQVGRGGFEGGLADAYGLANQAALNMQRSQIMQNYNLARSQLMRQDIEQGQNMLNQAQQGVTGQAGQAAGYLAQRQAPTPWLGMAAGALSTGAAGMGAMSGLAGGGYGNSLASYSVKNAMQPINTKTIGADFSKRTPFQPSITTPWG